MTFGNIWYNILMQKRRILKRLVTPSERSLCPRRAAARMGFLTQKPDPSFLNIVSGIFFLFLKINLKTYYFLLMEPLSQDSFNTWFISPWPASHRAGFLSTHNHSVIIIIICCFYPNFSYHTFLASLPQIGEFHAESPVKISEVKISHYRPLMSPRGLVCYFSAHFTALNPLEKELNYNQMQFTRANGGAKSTGNKDRE